MANVTVRLYGVLRLDAHLDKAQMQANQVQDIFTQINAAVEERFAETLQENPQAEKPPVLSYNDVIVYINGARCFKKKTVLKDGDDIWLMSPASGG